MVTEAGTERARVRRTATAAASRRPRAEDVLAVRPRLCPRVGITRASPCATFPYITAFTARWTADVLHAQHGRRNKWNKYRSFINSDNNTDNCRVTCISAQAIRREIYRTLLAHGSPKVIPGKVPMVSPAPLPAHCKAAENTTDKQSFLSKNGAARRCGWPLAHSPSRSAHSARGCLADRACRFGAAGHWTSPLGTLRSRRSLFGSRNPRRSV